MIREKLLGSEEFNAVHDGASSFREHLRAYASKHVTHAVSQASALVMDEDETVVTALERLVHELEART